MLAIDTNVVVRYLVDDDHDQYVRAEQLVENATVFVANTVLLECEWVLRSGYGYEAAKFVEAIREFAGLPTVNLESPKLAATALAWHERGMDFADAMHLSRSEDCEAFLSFDKRLAKAAAKVRAMEVREP
jgi:predicted nucleic-acid-binding protein